MSDDRSGYVYILSNPVMPGIVKIGRSIHGGRNRARDIYKQGGTGVPMPFKMEFEIWSKDCHSDEEYIHETLKGCRINNSREFFEIEIESAVLTVTDTVMQAYSLTVEAADFSISQYELENNYGEISRNAISKIYGFENFSAPLLSIAIANHLSENEVYSAIERYKNACDKRALDRIESNKKESCH